MIRHLYLACLVPISIALLSCGESTPQPQKGKYGYLPSPTPKAAAPTPTPIPQPRGRKLVTYLTQQERRRRRKIILTLPKSRVNPVGFTALMRPTQGKSTSKDILLELK